jgi:hypothetical protein
MPQSGFEEATTVRSSGSLDVWVKELAPKLPGAAEGYIYDQLKVVISDFFRRTKCWRETLGPYDLIAGENEIGLNPVDASTQVIQVLEVRVNGRLMAPVQDAASELRLDADGSVSQGTARAYYVRPYDCVYLVPIPDTAQDQIYVTAVLTPRISSRNAIDQWIIDQHYEVIKAGVLERMYNEPSKNYTNTKQGEIWGARYRSDMSAARAQGSQNYKAGPHTWTYPAHTR